ncbi:hypothetical protein BHM03_00029814 [Ensete ventricosum]|uniref:Uncharacterized protein n=1 Tax=Ensete ventricosum TaxID=4639 RepID=A0A445MI31_ENSVE|nr:hypothetical protein BHM03_00029814 [Ensete ventricosum]
MDRTRRGLDQTTTWRGVIGSVSGITGLALSSNSGSAEQRTRLLGVESLDENDETTPLDGHVSGASRDTVCSGLEPDTCLRLRDRFPFRRGLMGASINPGIQRPPHVKSSLDCFVEKRCTDQAHLAESE